MFRYAPLQVCVASIAPPVPLKKVTKRKQYKKTQQNKNGIAMRSRLLFHRKEKYQLLVFSLASGFRLFLTLHAGLLVTLTLAKFSEDAGTCALTLEATQSTIQGFSLFYLYFCHSVSPPSRKPRCRAGGSPCANALVLYYTFYRLSIDIQKFCSFFCMAYLPVTRSMTTSQGLNRRGANGTLLDVPREITNRPS